MIIVEEKFHVRRCTVGDALAKILSLAILSEKVVIGTMRDGRPYIQIVDPEGVTTDFIGIESKMTLLLEAAQVLVCDSALPGSKANVIVADLLRADLLEHRNLIYIALRTLTYGQLGVLIDLRRRTGVTLEKAYEQAQV